MRFAQVATEGIVCPPSPLGCPPSPLALTLFLPPLLRGSLSSLVGDLINPSHFGLSVPKISHSLCNVLAVGVCICSYLLQEEVSLMMAKQGTSDL